MNESKTSSSTAVLFLGFAIWSIFAWITWISSNFAYEVPNEQRPIVLVTSLLICAGILSLFALWLALKVVKPHRDFIIFTFLFAIAFRLIQLFSEPFQEIDNYRYMWDGIVLSKGYSPYRFSPYQVLEETTPNEERDQLREIALRSQSTETIISRVHYSHVRTVYPPTSQVVFGVTMALVPKESSVSAHVIAIKSAITLFDVGTLFLLAYLLSLLRINVLWSMAYGWNPLVIKEFANSGHLDSIAVFFTMLSIVFAVRAFRQDKSANRNVSVILAALFLAFGLAAKIYPLILGPFVAVWIGRNMDWKKAFLFGGGFVVLSTICMLPMVIEMQNQASEKEAAVTNKEGLSTFLRKWEINELPYMIVHQNLKAIDPDREINVPWFRIQNESMRQALLNPMAQVTGEESAPYYMSRAITIGIFAIIYVWLIWSVYKHQQEPDLGLLASCFVIIAAFFCLQPTQNPWYWTWAIPFLPFARNRAWLGYSVFLFVYYFRFWFAKLSGEYEFLGGYVYSGSGLFDYVIVWLEHLPIFLAVGWYHFLGRRSKTIQGE